MQMGLPKDPVMLLSVVNTKAPGPVSLPGRAVRRPAARIRGALLRYPSRSIDHEYDASRRRFARETIVCKKIEWILNKELF